MDLSYLNARIRAWKGDLLTQAAYDKLIGAEGIQGILYCLKDTVYARDIEVASARYKDETEIAEGAFRVNFARTFKQLWDYSPEDARILLQAVFSIWEAYDLKAIARARANGISPDDSISVLIPAGEMDESALKELNRQKDVQEVAKLLYTWGSPYARPLKDAIEQYLRERHLIIIELALDRFVHKRCLSAAAGNEMNRKIIERFIRQRIDSINISTVLKLAGEGLSPAGAAGYFLEGGKRINKDEFLQHSASKDKKTVLQGLADSVKDSRWKKVIGAADHDEAFFLEEQLEELTRKEMCRIAVIEPLSIALAVCFVYKKIREIKNMRIIARAKIFDMPSIEAKRFIII